MTSVLSAIVAVILRVGLQVFDRKILNKNPKLFSEIMQKNSTYPFLFSILFILVLGQRQSLFEYLFSWMIIAQGAILACASWSVSFGLKNMNLRYVVVVQKLVDLIIPFILIASHSTQTIHWELFISILFYIPFVYYGIKFRNICFVSVFCIISTIGLQAFFGSLASKDRPDSIIQFCAYVAAILFWRWVIGGWSLLLSKTKNSLDRGLKVQLVVRAGFAYLSQIAFFLAITSENASQSWTILNASPVFCMLSASLFLGEKLLLAELVSVFCLVVGFAVCCMYYQ